MNKYRSGREPHTKIMVEELIDQLLVGWKTSNDPLRQRMLHALAAQLEGIREPDYSMYDMERILATANIIAQEQEACIHTHGKAPARSARPGRRSPSILTHT